MPENKKNPWEQIGANDGSKSLQQLQQKTQEKTLTDINFNRLFRIWPYALAFCIVGLLIGNFYSRYIVTTYFATTKINIQQKEEITLQQAVSGTSRDPFNDRIAYLKSTALASTVVKKLNLVYNVILQGKFKDKSLYNVVKWKILNLDTPNPNFSILLIPINGKLVLEYNKKRYNNFVFNSPINLENYTIQIDSLRPFNFTSTLKCSLKDELTIATEISNSLTIKADKESNIIDISYFDISPERAKDVLNALVTIYNNVLSQDKSQGFSQAIDFINKRLVPLSIELDSIENNLSIYQSSHGFVSENSNGQLYLDKVQEIDKKLIDIDIQKTNIESIEKFVDDNTDKEFNFNVVGINDAGIQKNIETLQQLRIEKDKLLNTLTTTHPSIKIIDTYIAQTKQNIKVQLSLYKKNINTSREFCLGKINETKSLIKSTPNEEKGLIDIKRMRNIKEALFLALLQKREEAAIAKASTTTDTKILTPAIILPAQQKPSKNIIIVFAGLLGFFLPIIFFIVKELLNNKIVSTKQLESYLSIPVLAELEFVENSKNNNNLILKGSDRTLFGEQLRSLRTQLDFYKKENKNLSILITSNISGEGKSFLSLNLAKSFALQNKKVALLEFDLRRPKISKGLNIELTTGISSFLLGKIGLDKIFQSPFTEVDKFHFYPAGPIPPNPQELLSNEKIIEMKNYFDNNYDIIIIDTPPYGIVADAQILSKLVDTTIVVTRFNYTIKDQIIEIDKWVNNKIFPSTAVVLNGIKHKGYYGYKYGYYNYKRKYGYNYYSTEN